MVGDQVQSSGEENDFYPPVLRLYNEIQPNFVLCVSRMCYLKALCAVCHADKSTGCSGCFSFSTLAYNEMPHWFSAATTQLHVQDLSQRQEQPVMPRSASRVHRLMGTRCRLVFPWH